MCRNEHRARQGPAHAGPSAKYFVKLKMGLEPFLHHGLNNNELLPSFGKVDHGELKRELGDDG